MDSAEVTTRSYLRTMLAVSALTLVAVFGVNALCDPLWNLGGNRLWAVNYAFNERHSKTNLYLRRGLDSGCVILGSSRATLLDAERIGGLRCFNYSFSAGTPREFVYFAQYMVALGHRPEMLVVGVDGRNFSREELGEEVPEFVRQLERPPGPLETYLSLSTLDFSVRTLLGDSPWPRYYRADLSADVLPGTPYYRPPDCFNTRDRGKLFDLDNLRYYEDLLDVIPEARAVGYVPPVSAWDVASLRADGTLGSYLEAIYAAAALFGRFYDFSIPSAVTGDPRHTYDGDHYSREVNDRIARALDEDHPSFGVALHNLTLEGYKATFESAVRDFVDEEGFEPVFSPDCGYISAVR